LLYNYGQKLGEKFMSLNIDSIQNMIFYGLIEIIIFSVILFLSIKVRHFITEFNDSKLTIENNTAMAISQFGYLIAVLLILSSSIFARDYENIFESFFVTFIFSTVGIVFLSLNRYFVNNLYLKGLIARDEIEKNNTAFAIFQAGGFISTGIIINENFYGFEFSLDLIIVTFFTFIITQFAMFITAKLFIAKTIYDDIKEIKNNNIAVSIENTSLLISIAFLFGNVIKEITEFNIIVFVLIIFYFLVSTTFLIFVPKFIASVLTTKERKGKDIEILISENNIPIAVISAISKFLLTIIAMVVIPFDIIIL
jgi:uncharacterized membrane protein YjfL (UPF0719 family)